LVVWMLSYLAFASTASGVLDVRSLAQPAAAVSPAVAPIPTPTPRLTPTPTPTPIPTPSPTVALSSYCGPAGDVSSNYTIRVTGSQWSTRGQGVTIAFYGENGEYFFPNDGAIPIDESGHWSYEIAPPQQPNGSYKVVVSSTTQTVEKPFTVPCPIPPWPTTSPTISPSPTASQTTSPSPTVRPTTFPSPTPSSVAPLAQLTIRPPSGSSGQSIVVSGTGYPPNAGVTMALARRERAMVGRIRWRPHRQNQTDKSPDPHSL
jgi:hypothetical protein